VTLRYCVFIGGFVKIKIIAIAAALLFSSPLLADEYFAVTPSGAAEMVFSEAPGEVVGKLSSKCIDAAWKVISSNDREVVCEAPMNFGQSFMGQLLMGNSYSTPPRRFFKFNIADVQNLSRVQASGWMELQMAFGQMKRNDFSGPEFHNSIINFMSAAGGSLPIGTSFPNHVVMGFEAKDVSVGKYIGQEITQITEGSAVQKAGLVPGDIITKIAGKKFKNYDNFLDATAKAAKSPTYEIEFQRNGKSQTAMLTRAFRDPITESAKPRELAVKEKPAAIQPASIADEIAKLAKLKDDKLLTEEEFQSQKAKLLSQ
jgi:hypothetical protein